MKRSIFLLVIIFVFVSQIMFGQNLISGNVIRENKKPLPGVKVTIDGVQGVESQTDQLGNFDIEVPLTAKILIFSYEGMKTQKEGIGKKSFIAVTMIEGKDEIPPPVVKKEEKPKTTSKEAPKKNESDNTKVKTNPQKDSKGNKPNAIVTPDSTVKESKPKEKKASKPKENSKDKETSKPTKTKEGETTVSDSVKVENPKTEKPAKTSKEEPKKAKKSK